MWSGRTSLEKAEAYERFLKENAYPDYGGVSGNRGWFLLRRQKEGAVEFTFVSLWESVDALRRYAGDAIERPKYFEEDRDSLLELPDHVDHYDVVDVHLER